MKLNIFWEKDFPLFIEEVEIKELIHFQIFKIPVQFIT